MTYDYYVVDTNVLLRYLLKDDEKQFNQVQPYFLATSCKLVLSIHTLCETVWFMRNRLKVPNDIMIALLNNLASQQNIIIDKMPFQQGILFIENGGDFADGVIANEINHFENACFLSFDNKAKNIASKLNLTFEHP